MRALSLQANGKKHGGPVGEELSLRVSPGYIIFFVLLMCGMLVMLYFFFDYLGKYTLARHAYVIVNIKICSVNGNKESNQFCLSVYLIIGMFCLATTIAVYSCFEPVIMWSYEADCMSCIPTLRLPRCNLYLCIINMELRQVSSAMLSYYETSYV